MAPKRKKSRSAERKKGKGKDKKNGSAPPQEKSDLPDGIFPLVLTTATQELLGCRADEDVTKEDPHKLLDKDDILQDMKTRAAVSDFSPVKKAVMDYPEDLLLLVYDWSFTYGQNFFLVLTPEAKDRILNPPEPEPPEGAEEEVPRTPERRPWIPLGSEQEIEAEYGGQSRVQLRFQFSRVRRKFGVPVRLSDRNASEAKESSLKCAPYQDRRFSIVQMQRDYGVQLVQQVQTSSAQTHWKFLRNVFTHYEPNLLSDTEQTAELRSEGLKTFCGEALTSMLQTLREEAIMNTCVDDWKALETAEAGDWSVKATEGLSFYQAFTDNKYSKGKKISTMNWHPTIQGVVAVALTDIQEERWEESYRTDVTPPFIVFYCFSDPTSPQLLLECPDDVLVFDFCPSHPHLVVGGCMNGQVVLWNILSHVTRLQEVQSGGKKVSVNIEDLKDEHKKVRVVSPCSVSASESSHKTLITDLQWLPDKFQLPGAEGRKTPTTTKSKSSLPAENQSSSSVQVLTCSPDRTILFWDVQIPSLQDHGLAPPTLLSPRPAPDPPRSSAQTWKPLLRMSVSRAEARGDFSPLKISLKPPSSDKTSSATEKPTEDQSSEVVSEGGQSDHSPKTRSTPEDRTTTFYMGTEDGEMVYCDWTLAQEDSGRMFKTKPLFWWRVHYGLVNTIQRSPFFKDVVLTVGGQNFAIWREDVKDGPVLMSPSSDRECTAGCWSPVRPAVFFIGKDDGSIEVWNLLTNACAPLQVNPYVANVQISCIKPWIFCPKQHFLAVVDVGMLRVLELPQTLRNPIKKEGVNVRRYLDLEQERLMDRLNTQEGCGQPKQEAGQQQTDQDQDLLEEADRKEFNDYLKLKESV